jgi:PAS domain S-box-containing protein
MISQLQKYKKQIRALLKELAEIKGRHDFFMQMCPDAIITVCDGKFISVNEAGVRLYGVKRDVDLMGKMAIDFIHPDYRDIVRERMKELSKGKSVPLLEEKLIRYDGDVIDIEAVATPFMRNGKRLTQVMIRDITDRKNAFKLLEEKNIALRELINQIRQEKSSAPVEHLSPKEIIICDMIRKKISNKEIARVLKISPLTVGTFRNRIRKKLKLDRKVNLTVYLQNN